MSAVDAFGKPLQVGSKVIFMQIGYRHFIKGEIVRLTPKFAIIRHAKTNVCSTESKQEHSQIILDES